MTSAYFFLFVLQKYINIFATVIGYLMVFSLTIFILHSILFKQCTEKPLQKPPQEPQYD